MYALLVNKTQPTYQRIIEEVKRLVDGSAPATLLMDFECVALNAAAAVFPGAVVKGCFFICAKMSTSISRVRDYRLCIVKIIP